MALDGESVIPMDNEQLSKDKKSTGTPKNQLHQGVYKVGRISRSEYLTFIMYGEMVEFMSIRPKKQYLEI